MISIIIPVKNEEKRITALIEELVALEGEKELIIVDGGSSDKTLDLLVNMPMVKVLGSMPGRGRQLHEGAKAACGDVLWFIHADSRLEGSVIPAIETAVESAVESTAHPAIGLDKVSRNGRSDYIGGCLSIYFHDESGTKYRWLAWSSNLRAKYLGLMFGDQGIFVRRDVYFEMEGFKQMPLMEDWEFSRRLIKKGRTCVLPHRIGTSARRFQKGGFLKTLLQMHRIKLMYVMGQPIDKIAAQYKNIR